LATAQPGPAGPDCCGQSWGGLGSHNFLAESQALLQGLLFYPEATAFLFVLVPDRGKMLDEQYFLFSLKLKNINDVAQY
jgi:hypothetical protein